MHDPNNPVFETTDTGCHVAGTGLPRLEAASRSGARARSRGGSLLNGWGWWDMIGRRPRRRPRAGDSRGPRADPYAGEEGPGRVSRLARLRMDLWGYGAGNTKDAYGTEADVRAISESNQHWAGFKLRVLTQNLWGIPVISRCLEARVHAFAKTLGGGWDVIALQEVWHARERDALRRAALAAGLRYSRHFEHGCGAPLLGPGMGGTGLLILSRFPITESFFRGRYKSHRVAQAFEVAHIIRLTSRSPLVLLLSDLNAGPGSMPYGLQRSVAGLLDAFGEAKPDQDGFTCEATDNVFSNGRDPPARLDYVLFKALPPPLCAPQAVEPTWELSKCWVHRAVAAEFTARDPEGGDDDDHSSLDDDIDGMPPPRRGLRHSQSIPGGTFPQGPLLARALTEIDRGIEEASNRRTCHLRTAKALATLWLALLAGGAVAKSDGLMGYIARGAAGVFGGVLCTAASALFLLYWFSAKQEVQGLKEVFQTATNYERHLPMEEAFPDGGFDTSQLYSYMEQHFR
ncbi:similar to neutral Sphingomyelinase, putative [Ectocarpus siliculosus]|uniref:Similar to neutral Sphingomyelinase, putative n=1 Tax=Ectocarpus siliculosus TaxID=2880 RepID=D8LH10_ECTSI|nr:similar to neutral Sphingomyelinase, putative [Ectocarpus siliculosus]|eukprot:CBN75863.1 similar to neutral Sphingomyelinase, putative [Ectocarpus siliculosus]